MDDSDEENGDGAQCFVKDCMNAVWNTNKNKKEWHQATKPLNFLTLLPPIGAYTKYSSAYTVQANLMKIHLF
jgi:hypothetical protein